MARIHSSSGMTRRRYLIRTCPTKALSRSEFGRSRGEICNMLQRSICQTNSRRPALVLKTFPRLQEVNIVFESGCSDQFLNGHKFRISASDRMDLMRRAEVTLSGLIIMASGDHLGSLEGHPESYSDSSHEPDNFAVCGLACLEMNEWTRNIGGVRISRKVQ
jgi:hypothetical protein